jgi:hypothetical protein
MKTKLKAFILKKVIFHGENYAIDWYPCDDILLSLNFLLVSLVVRRWDTYIVLITYSETEKKYSAHSS